MMKHKIGVCSHDGISLKMEVFLWEFFYMVGALYHKGMDAVTDERGTCVAPNGDFVRPGTEVRGGHLQFNLTPSLCSSGWCKEGWFNAAEIATGMTQGCGCL